MQVFHNQQQGLLRRMRHQQRQEGFQCFLLLPLRGQRQRGIAILGQRQQGSKQGHGLGQGQAILGEHLLKRAQFVGRRLGGLEL